MELSKREKININYKDEFPEVTVQRFRETFKNLGVDIKEIVRDSGVGTYWVTLLQLYKGIEIYGSGGKGNTPMIALASAYGELMEYYQGQIFSTAKRIIDNPGFLLYDTKDFLFRPDEKQYRDINKYFKEDRYYNELTRDCTEDVRKVLDNIHYKYFEDMGYIPTVEYQSYDGKDRLDINEVLLQYMMTSSGNAAGNTKYEALIQATSEVIERYVKYLIFRDDICLPLIPIEAIQKSEHAYRVYRDINSSERYTLEFRDASLGGKYPVVAAILYDRDKIGYTVDFGCFPVFNTAIDRTVNELMQFQEIDDIRSVEYYAPIEVQNYLCSAVGVTNSVLERYMNSGISNRAIFGDNFISHEYTYEYSGWEEYRGNTNEELFYEFCSNIENHTGEKIYYKEVDFLGYPTYRVYSHEISMGWFLNLEGYESYNIHSKKHYIDYIFKNSISKEEFLEKSKNDINSNYIQDLGVEYIKDNVDFIKIKEAFIEFVRGDHNEASFKLRESIIQTPKKTRMSVMYECVSSVIYLKQKYTEEVISQMLDKMFSIEEINTAIMISKNIDSLKRAIYLDRDSPICIVDWELTEKEAEVFNKLQNIKREYYNLKGDK